jgi:hypothetical protein
MRIRVSVQRNHLFCKTNTQKTVAKVKNFHTEGKLSFVYWGWLYGMEMDSYKSQILDGVLVQKMKSYEPVSQIACVSVSFFWY